MAAPSLGRVAPRRKFVDTGFKLLCLFAVLVACLALASLLWTVFSEGASKLRPEFLTSFASRKPERAGIYASIMGSLWVIALTVLMAVPVGVAAAIYLEEFAPKANRWVQLVQLNVSNLAGVPSIVYGLLGLGVFVRFFALDRSVIAGALTMGLLVLPLIIVVSQEAIRAVPKEYKIGAIALGATPWQALRTQVLPTAVPGISTGVILAIARAIGETAPLITIGAVTYIATVPQNVRSKFTVLPITIFDWSSRPQKEFQQLAASAIIVLMAILIVLSSFAILIRTRASRRM